MRKMIACFTLLASSAYAVDPGAAAPLTRLYAGALALLKFSGNRSSGRCLIRRGCART